LGFTVMSVGGKTNPIAQSPASPPVGHRRRNRREPVARVSYNRQYIRAPTRFVAGSTFICLWVISACLMSTIGLSPEAEGLYLIIPSTLAMACLSVPIGRFLAALLDP
jgi:hypothetical protein